VSERVQDFKDDHVRIKINQIQQKETVRSRVLLPFPFPPFAVEKRRKLIRV
jgi:hypothetical protein